MNPNIMDNYRPISNLPFFIKIIEKLLFLNQQNILENCQSGFRANRSTKMAISKISTDLRNNSDLQKLSVLVLLDLSATFDAVDHHIWLDT